MPRNLNHGHMKLHFVGVIRTSVQLIKFNLLLVGSARWPTKQATRCSNLEGSEQAPLAQARQGRRVLLSTEVELGRPTG